MLFRRIGQPSVIGEICAGLALGPSLLGLFYPDFYKFIFPAPSLGNLQLLSQFGLIIFMFVVGMELDISVLKEKAKSAILISHISILFPFLLGCVLSLYFFDKYAPENISFLSFGLFLGIAMSITAFPVLARIIQEKGLSKSTIGIVALTCAAVDDISAWTVLALILAIIQAGSVHLIFLILLFSLIYISVMIYITQPVLEKMSKLYITKEIISRGVISILTILMLCSAMVSESLGIHALFGAFLAGVIMPTNTRLRGVITEKFEDFSAVLLLPLFFAYTGIRTRIQLLNSQDLWIDCIIVVLIASLGKILGSLFAARFTGVSWRESAIIGFLMNTRGLMELVILNIGYDMGILSPEIFTMFVIMALVTT
ncbi:MAG: cation/H(+) antiporter, partial [Spirochaetia bacterium]|nr:cation/H(+) antiporter [Spirochaetia bacterium]